MRSVCVRERVKWKEGERVRVVKREGEVGCRCICAYMVIYVFGKGNRVAKTHGDQEAYVCGREMEAIRRGVIWKGLRTGSETAIHRWPVWSVLSLRGHVQ